MSVMRWKKLILTVLGVAICGTAQAEPGDGIRSDSLQASLGLTLSGSYDTNVFYESEDETTSLSAAPSLRFTPFLSLGSLNPGTVQYQADASLTWQQYLDSDLAISEQSGLSANLGGTLGINRDGAVSITFKERFARTNEAPDGPILEAYNRNVNSLGASLGLHPGGKVFQHYLSYDWILYQHEDIASINRMTHNLSLTNYWRFLPRTAATLSFDYQIVQYDEEIQTGGVVNSNSTPLRVNAGLTGLITNRVSANLVGGWGWSFHSGNGPSFSGLLLDARLSWAFGLLSSKNNLYVGYSQGFADTTIGNFYNYYRPYAGYNQRLAERLSLQLETELSIRDYAGTPDFAGDLSDMLVGARAGLGFQIFKWWSADVAYRLSMNVTDDELLNPSLGLSSLREYSKHLVTFGTTVRY